MINIDNLYKVENFNDLKRKILPYNLELIEQGSYCKYNSDFYDYFIIIKVNGFIQIYYSSNGHGFGMNYILNEYSTEKDFNNFFDRIENFDLLFCESKEYLDYKSRQKEKYRDFHNEVCWLRDKYENVILENWKKHTKLWMIKNVSRHVI